MPHLVIEYAHKLEQELSIPALVSAAHEAVSNTKLFATHTIKTRAIAYTHYIAGGALEGSSDSFIHAEVRIFSGRNDKQREALSCAVFNCLCNAAQKVSSVTVEVREMNRSCYSKRLPF
ncbi:MAG: 5-carboxymethyl-2-hydroxymuconate Delta-isomerase [Gammaproteobacteria bacterium]|nr:5-carboxymethyl-2-hydroxymuconate Delta-isomerase [Gammaproteobacteria bacterium]